MASVLISAKELLHIQRYNAYWRAHGHQGTSGKPIQACHQCPHIPDALTLAALEELPTESPLFRDVAISAKLLDEMGLDEWDRGPPYYMDPSPDTPHEHAFMQHLIEVMHGRWLRMQREEEQSWCEDGYEELMARLERGIVEWEEGRAFVAQYQGGHQECVMARLWLGWIARGVHALNLEISN